MIIFDKRYHNAELVTFPSTFTDCCLYLKFGIFYHGYRDSASWHKSDCHHKSDLTSCKIPARYIEFEVLDLHALLGFFWNKTINDIIVLTSGFQIESTMDTII